ncbi:SDR family oxidoreductase [Rhodococcus sp. BP-252]|uniref:Short chain dehydrogenase n=1 Tax=Rhodococcoides kyotonense TaxID=398843 RepID=A0A177YIG4_9NOCA|nr:MULTISPECIES: SDR family oxidoreductase [Rhodococcus]MBY6414597.1 SDR family oxidoreductase [Rhodococcus sp. BP-320]MBY6419354.1 SDR family oxidoreductase [Rhodococcus sp. BP-321]MBY6424336.1 SDR family oxidoreductase [Rhodococcus sp. BP-324]MBY6429433.1 SDR family oxidoreductase [Rhodococcus sp. BP-323]MBY6431952.1 SDR family oxidoreductase [Rhodococcus sp. BP-322]
MTITNLRGKKTFITGAGSGIGRATALAAANEGAELYLTDINEASLKDTVAAVGNAAAMSQAFDVSDYDAVTAFATEVHDAAGSLDVVMNIAGVSAWGTVENLEHRQWKSMVDVNLMGPIHVMENFLPPMIHAGRGGHLVNVSSAAGLIPLPWHAAYSASKYGLRGASEVLRYDMKRHGIGVSLVVPGGVKTGLVDTVEIAGVDRDDPRVKKLQHRFEKRAVTPDKVAEAILKGIYKNRYLVYSSNDIRFGYWWARKFAPPYEFVLQKANDQFSKLL